MDAGAELTPCLSESTDLSRNPGAGEERPEGTLSVLPELIFSGLPGSCRTSDGSLVGMIASDSGRSGVGRLTVKLMEAIGSPSNTSGPGLFASSPESSSR